MKDIVTVTQNDFNVSHKMFENAISLLLDTYLYQNLLDYPGYLQDAYYSDISDNSGCSWDVYYSSDDEERVSKCETVEGSPEMFAPLMRHTVVAKENWERLHILVPG